MKRTLLILLTGAVLFYAVAASAQTSAYTITFAENPTTGYAWFCTVSDDAVITVTDSGYLPAENAQGLAGVGGTHSWTVAGTGAGEASISFCYTWVWTEEMPEPCVVYTFAADAAGNLTLVSTEGLPEQYMPGKVAVRLLANPTTGYEWIVDTDQQGILSLVNDTYEPNENTDGLVGAGGIHTWIFDILAQGTVVLNFRYIRSFEPDASPAAAVQLTYLVDRALTASLMGIDGDYSQYVPDSQ